MEYATPRPLEIDFDQLSRIYDELNKAQSITVPYSIDQLDMANMAIKQMQYHIERTFARIDGLISEQGLDEVYSQHGLLTNHSSGIGKRRNF